MLLCICARNNQCTKPCSNECYYTTVFPKSKLYLYHDEIKPKEITFVKDLRGDFWEINPDFDHNLPETMIATPVTLIHRSYDQIVQRALL